MSANRDAKTSNINNTKGDVSNTTDKLSTANFKPYAAPRRKAGLRDDQVSISKHSIALPIAVANKLGDKVALLFSDQDKAIAIKKAADGDFKLKSVGKNKSTKSLYAKSLIEVKKIKPARYSTSWDEKNSMLIARVA